MTEPTAADSSAAAALVAAGATAAGPCPADPIGVAAWERLVAERAHALAALVPAVAERIARIAECHPVTGVIVSVREVSGRAVITTRPTMGNRETEDFRTDWLNEPAGAALAAQARALVGHHVRLGKRIEATRDGQKKVGMVEWIADLGPAEPAATATPPRATATVTAPVIAPPPAVTAPADDDPFRPFDEADELLAGPVWARKFAVAMTASGWGKKTMAAVIRYATGGRTSDARSVLRTEVTKVAATHRLLDAGELAQGSDGHLVDVRASQGPGAAA